MKDDSKKVLNPKYDAVLFDFDGTICDSWVLVKKAYTDSLLTFFPDSCADHIEAIRSCNNYHLSHQLLFKQDEVDNKYYTYTASMYEKYLKKEKTPIYSGVEEIINLLNDKKIPWGIVTTKRRRFVNIIINQYSFLQTNSILLCSEDVKKGKPDPEGLIKACCKLRISSNRAVYIGDLPADIKAANACEMDSIWASYGYHEKLIDVEATASIKKLDDLKKLLLSN